jgi:hypothetical protein
MSPSGRPVLTRPLLWLNRLDITRFRISSRRMSRSIEIIEDNDPDTLARMEQQLRWERRQRRT